MMMAFHIWGMYLFSPVVGWLTDRYGQYPMLYVSGGLCTWGAVWAAVTPPDGLLGVFMGNFLIGLGWSFGVIAASSLIVGQFPIEQRVGVQGVGRPGDGRLGRRGRRVVRAPLRAVRLRRGQHRQRRLRGAADPRHRGDVHRGAPPAAPMVTTG